MLWKFYNQNGIHCLLFYNIWTLRNTPWFSTFYCISSTLSLLSLKFLFFLILVCELFCQFMTTIKKLATVNMLIATILIFMSEIMICSNHESNNLFIKAQGLLIYVPAAPILLICTNGSNGHWCNQASLQAAMQD